MVIPIHKCDQPTLPNNYRPISFLLILSKVLEKIINHQIWEYLDCNQLVARRQFSFRSGTSTDPILTQLVNKIRFMLSKQESKFVTLSALDIRKAFDCVNHDILLTKLLLKFNFHQNSQNLIKNYLHGRVHGHISDTLSVQTGVPQGSVLKNPAIYNVY